MVKKTGDMGSEEEIAEGPNTSIITHTKTHVGPEQTVHTEVSLFNKTNQCNVENPLVKCDHSVVEIIEFKKTRADDHFNVESPLAELGLKKHIIVAISVVPEKTDHSEVRLLTIDTRVYFFLSLLAGVTISFSISCEIALANDLYKSI